MKSINIFNLMIHKKTIRLKLRNAKLQMFPLGTYKNHMKIGNLVVFYIITQYINCDIYIYIYNIYVHRCVNFYY